MRSFFSARVIVKTGDITLENIDVIVNAANSSLMGGGGVDGAIHKAGGSEILKECEEIIKSRYPKGLPAGKAVLTGPGKLKAYFIAHTVGPVYGREKGKEAALLASCYNECLDLVREKGLKSIAFPSISTGAYGYPKAEAAKVVGDTLKKYLEKHDIPDMIDLIFFSQEDYETFLDNCGW